MRRAFLWSLVIVGGILTAGQADEPGWLDRVNPFASKPAPKPHMNHVRNNKPDNSKQGFGIWPRSQTKPTTTVANPQDNRSFMTKTKETLLPWTKPEPAPQNRFARRTQAPKKEPFYSGWFSKTEEKPPQQTPADFIGQTRPQFY